MKTGLLFGLLICAWTAVSAQQQQQADTILVAGDDGATADNNRRNEAYLNFLWNKRGGYFSLGVEGFHRYFEDNLSGRVMVDLNLGGFDNEAFFSLRGGYILGVNLVPNLNLQGFAALGVGYYTGNKSNNDDEELTFGDEEEGFFDFVNTLTLSLGSSLNFTYFYPLTLYLRAEAMGIAGGGIFTTYGGGIKYTFRSK